MNLFFYILVSGLLGVVGHWLNRWVQGRTESTFIEYMSNNKARSISSILSIVTTSSVTFTQTPEDIHGKALMLVLLFAYTSAYMLDSTVNKDITPNESPEQVKDKRQAKKSLNDVLRDDSRL